MNVLILLAVLGVLALFAGITTFRKHIFSIVLVGIAGIFVLNFFNWNLNTSYFSEMMTVDNYAVAFTGVILFVSFLIFLLSKNQFLYDEINTGDYYGIILFTLAGAVMMVSFANLVMLFIGIETLSISLYVLAGSRRHHLSSNEASLKYFLTGAFATGFLLFGITMIYGSSGSFNLREIQSFASAGITDMPYLFIGGMLLIMTGLLFKVSAAPFHFWAPDVYQGSPNIITALMATVVKTAAFAAFLRLFFTSFEALSSQFNMILAGVAILTLIIGNFSALYQTNLKRLLAYSSIAHAGYLLLAIITLNEDSDNALLYYSLSYSVASIGAFAVLIYMAQTGRTVEVKSLNGLAKTNPLTAFFFTIILLSLAGIPPTAGFFAKYYMFSAGLKNGYFWLVLIAVLTALVGIYYYFRIIIAMYGNEPESEPLTISAREKMVLILCAVLSLVLGLLPDVILNLL